MRGFYKISLYFVLAGILGVSISAAVRARDSGFNGQNALTNLHRQVDFGPRTPGSQAHQQTVEFIQEELLASGWQVELQAGTQQGHPLTNIIASRGEGTTWILLGAHYDSRLLSDKDHMTDNRSAPVPGANDGASGVAILLELARVIPDQPGKKISLVFFDLEDQGKIPGWDWALGSQFFAENLITYPDAVVVLDMVGDSDLQIFQEQNSDPGINREIWDTARRLGFEDSFLAEEGYSIRDDHSPFLALGIPSVLIIDFNYPYHHTIADDLSKVSASSLSIVGNTILEWLKDR